MALRVLNFSSPSELAQFSANALKVNSAAVVVGGTGYTLGDILTVVGGTYQVEATFEVAGVSGGVISSVTVLNEGAYTAAPSNPVSVTGGTGANATFNLTTAAAVPSSAVEEIKEKDGRNYLFYWV